MKISPILILLGISVAVHTFGKRENSTATGTDIATGSITPAQLSYADYRTGALRSTSVVNYKARVGGFGNVMMIEKIAIKNEFDMPVKDVTITCEAFAPSGTLISRPATTIYEIVEPGKTRTFKNINVGFINSQSHKTSCEVTGVEVVTN